MNHRSVNSIIRVAINRPLYRQLDYLCDSSLLANLVGRRVRVPLGNTVITGLVVDSEVVSEFDELKSVIEVLDSKPLLDESMLELLTWASRYYLYPLGEVLFHALPVSIRKGRKLPKVQLWQASQLGSEFLLEDLKRAPKQQDMLQSLQGSEYSATQLQETYGDNWRSTIRQLEKKELLTQREMDADYLPKKIDQVIPEKVQLTLTEEQSSCVTDISTHIKEENLKPVLLHGITGSGKTEVYLRVISAVLSEGKQVLVLVPEIGLTPQLLYRFKEHYPQYNTVSLHSALADGERLQAWIGARSGEVDIVIGTRSAVFTPMRDIGMIIIDEEHDASFKQQEGFLYHGRDMAIKRASDSCIPILLGSATPSLESLHNVDRQRYQYLRLSNRPGKSQRPEMVVQDTRSLYLEAGISNLMMTEIRQHIDSQSQVMLFLNRRGFAPVLMCPSCGWHASCTQCDLGMTYHAKANKVICHHCGQEEIVNSTCPQCSNDRLTTQGQGTERIEQVLSSHFPNTPIIRIDRDSTSKKGALEEKLSKVNQGKPVILIGTQMLTKGHDFPNLTLVGILDVDQALFSMDYRAQERLTQQILQVAGRAGRGERKGRMVLQTSQPEHPLLISLLSKGYYSTAKDILLERKMWGYPPFGAQALIRVSANNAEAGMTFLSSLSDHLRSSDEGVELLGPMPSPLAKRAARYRSQLLLSSDNRGNLHVALNKALSHLLVSSKAGGIKWVIDVDPLDFL